jgi:hypothetical protein
VKREMKSFFLLPEFEIPARDCFILFIILVKEMCWKKKMKEKERKVWCRKKGERQVIYIVGIRIIIVQLLLINILINYINNELVEVIRVLIFCFCVLTKFSW